MLLIPVMAVLVSRALTLQAGQEIPGRIIILFLLRRSKSVTNVIVLPELMAGTIVVPMVPKLILCTPWNYELTVDPKLIAFVAIGHLRVPDVLVAEVNVRRMVLGIELIGELMDRLTTLFGIVPVVVPKLVTCD